MPPRAPKSIAIVGGGLTGLVAARELAEAGHNPTLFEKSTEIGGAISTVIKDSWLIEAGPNSLQQTAEVSALIHDLHLEDQVVTTAPTSKKRFIVRRGKLVPVPLSPPALLTSDLFSVGARMRVLGELLTRPRVRTTDTSLASFIASHFGQEIVDYGLNPLVAGVYAGDPEKLSARYAFPRLWQLERTHGSILRGFRAEARDRRSQGDPADRLRIISFASGLQTLPNAVATSLPVGTIRAGTAVTNVIPGQRWKIISTRGGVVETTEFDAIILAMPATGLAQLVFGTLGERPLASLEHQPNPPVSTLFLGFKRDQVAHPLDGFGALVPALERRNILGVLFSSTLFAGRNPEGHVALTVFAGGTRQPETARLPTASLLERVLPDLRELLGVTGDPVFTHHTFWPRAIPQYNLGHERFLEPMNQTEPAHPGLFIGGNARDGISLPDCIRSGRSLAAKVSNFLSAPRKG